MDKILTITWKELYSTFTDKPRLFFMLGTPLAISLILGLAFGGGSGDLTIQDIPIAVVNLDEGDGTNNLGATVASILLSEPIEAPLSQSCELSETAVGDQTQSLDGILNAERLSDSSIAKESVDKGAYAVAVIIPQDFTSKISAPQGVEIINQMELETVTIDIYGSGANPVSVAVVRSITEAIVTPFVTGNITIRATMQSILDNPMNTVALARTDENAFAGFGCGFQPDLGTIVLDREALNVAQARSPFEQVLIGLGSAQAVFFSLGTATASVRSIYDDRKSWILQRLLSSPTPRVYILAGKLVGTLVVVTLQIILLMVSLSLIASISNASITFLWGTDWLALSLILFAISIAVSGIAVFVIGLAPTPEQATVFGSLATLGLALLGGAFGFQMGEIAKISLIYWGVDAFDTLSAGSADIMVNLLVLFTQGIVFFGIGVWLFNRRVQV